MVALIAQFRIYLYAVVILGAIGFLYFWHYRPMGEIKDLKHEIKEKNIIIDLNQFENKKEVFEEKQKAIKNTLEKPKAKHEKDINLSVGVHTIIFD